MPFCPSFEPWAKLTPVQVRTSRPRIQNGGGVLPSGSLIERRNLDQRLEHQISSSAARLKPMSGENSSDSPILAAWPQSTPLVPRALAAMS